MNRMIPLVSSLLLAGCKPDMDKISSADSELISLAEEGLLPRVDNETLSSVLQTLGDAEKYSDRELDYFDFAGNGSAICRTTDAPDCMDNAFVKNGGLSFTSGFKLGEDWHISEL